MPALIELAMRSGSSYITSSTRRRLASGRAYYVAKEGPQSLRYGELEGDLHALEGTTSLRSRLNAEGLAPANPGAVYCMRGCHTDS